MISHLWLTPASAPATPLLTSCVLGRKKGTASAIKHTFHAFHQVRASCSTQRHALLTTMTSMIVTSPLPPGHQGWLHAGGCVSSSAGQETEEKTGTSPPPPPPPPLLLLPLSPSHSQQAYRPSTLELDLSSSSPCDTYMYLRYNYIVYKCYIYRFYFLSFFFTYFLLI